MRAGKKNFILKDFPKPFTGYSELPNCVDDGADYGKAKVLAEVLI